MSVLEEAKRIAAEFDYTDDDVRKGVAEFIKQMGGYGLEEGSSMLTKVQTRDCKRMEQH